MNGTGWIIKKASTAGVATIGRKKKRLHLHTLSHHNMNKRQNLTCLLNLLSDEAGPLSPFSNKGQDSRTYLPLCFSCTSALLRVQVWNLLITWEEKKNIMVGSQSVVGKETCTVLQLILNSLTVLVWQETASRGAGVETFSVTLRGSCVCHFLPTFVHVSSEGKKRRDQCVGGSQWRN